MMQAFRNSAKPLIFIVAVAFFAWLVLDLSGLSGGTGLLTATSVGKINGHSVDARSFQEAVSRFQEQRQRESPEPLGIADVAQIRDQVWEQFIQNRLLESEYRRWGISVTSQEIAGAIRNAPPAEFYQLPVFQTEGEFDPSKYERWLQSAEGQSYIPALEQQYRDQIMQAKLARHLVSAVYIPDAALWERFRDQNELIRLGIVTIPPAAISEGAVSVSPGEIEEYYRSNREEFRRSQTAFLSYIQVDRRPVASDTAAALRRAQELRTEIMQGIPFEEVAERESADTVSGSRGGDLGVWKRDTFDSEFERAAVSAPLNQVSEPALTQFGYHLIEITRRDADSLAGRHILVPIAPVGEHRDALDARADSLESLAADRLDPAALDTAARVLGLAVEVAGPVRKDTPSQILPDASVWAFQATVGEHSPVIETPFAFLVFRVDSVWDEGIPPLAQARPEAERKLLEQKQLAQARRLADEVVAQTIAGKALRQAAADLGLEYREAGPFARSNAPAIGRGPIGRAFALPAGSRSEPVEGANGYFILDALERIAADSSAFTAQLESLRSQALNEHRQIQLQQYLAALRSNARIVDQRDQFFRTTAQVEAETAGLPPLP